MFSVVSEVIKKAELDCLKVFGMTSQENLQSLLIFKTCNEFIFSWLTSNFHKVLFHLFCLVGFKFIEAFEIRVNNFRTFHFHFIYSHKNRYIQSVENRRKSVNDSGYAYVTQ